MSILSLRTITILEASGWHKNRHIDVSNDLALLKSGQYPIFDAVRLFLEQFGGLEISISRSARHSHIISVLYCDISHAFERGFDREAIQIVVDELKKDLCPIAGDTSNIEYLMDKEGAVYGLYDLKEVLFIGSSGEDAIENYCNWDPILAPFKKIPL